MKNLLSILLLCLLSLPIFSQSEIKPASKIQKVTVYQQGARIVRLAKTELEKGKTTVIFEALPAGIDPKSIIVKGENNILIASVSHELDYLNKEAISTEIQALKDRQLEIKDSLEFINSIRKVYLEEKNMILANKEIGGDDGLEIANLEAAAQFFRKRLMEIETELRKLKKSTFSLSLEKMDLGKQMLALNGKSDMPTSIIQVSISSPVKMKEVITLEYFVPDAGWAPDYDIRIKETDQPMDLVYKARVFQNTGEEWKNVKLTLSSGNPSISNNIPDLGPYYLTFNNYYKDKYKRRESPSESFAGVVSGRIRDQQNGDPLIGANILIKGTNIGTIADMDGNYSLQVPASNRTLVVSYTGYTSIERYAQTSILNVALPLNELMLDEVVVTALGSRTAGSSYNVDGIRVGKAKKSKRDHIPLAIQKGQTSTYFNIDIPYTIPSDGKEYDVTMLEYRIDADYSFHAVPKLSEDVFLHVELGDYTEYDLLSGPANLFYKGVYQGDTYLDLKEMEDTLSISVGRDPDILIERELRKDYSSKKIFGKYKKQVKSWEISIKNNKDVAVNVTLEDQFPLSKSDDIKVELIEHSNSKVDESRGTLKWDLDLNPKESKKLILTYSVKHPKKRLLMVE